MPAGDELSVKWEKGFYTVKEKSEAESTCNRCTAPILWTETRKGKSMPVDLMMDEQGHYTSHYETCAARKGDA